MTAQGSGPRNDAGAGSEDRPERRALARLRDPDGDAAASLAVLLFDHAVARRTREVFEPAAVAARVTAAVRAAAADPQLRERLVARLAAERAAAGHETRTLRTFLVPEANEALRVVLGQPVSPSEGLARRLLDHDAVRGLVSDVLQGALSRFAERLRSLDQGLLGGLGGRVARSGRGLLGGVVREAGAAAEGLLGGLKDEMGRALEQRVRDSLGGATDEAVRTMAAWLASPEHAPVLASLRLSVLDVFLDLPVGELLREADEVDDRAVVDGLLAALSRAAARADFEADLAARLDLLLDLSGERTLGALLDDLGLRETARETAVGLLAPAIRSFVATEAFEAWWSSLFG